MTNLSPANALFLASMNSIEQRLAEANSRISSGKRINVASDAPDQIDTLLQLRANREHNQQIQANLSLAQADAQSADNALTSALSLMDRASTLAAQGVDVTQTAATRSSMAAEAQSLLERMVAYSQTQVQGRYIFSGDLPSRPAYQLDLADSTGMGADTLQSAASTRLIEDPAGGTFDASKTAQEIFAPVTQSLDASGNPVLDDNGDPVYAPEAGNAFAALNTLRVALQNNDTAGIQTAINEIKQVVTHLNTMQGFYGSVLSRIQNASSFATSYDTQLKTEISNIEDADIPSAALELTQANTQMEAAMTMQGKMPHSTLFNYLG